MLLPPGVVGPEAAPALPVPLPAPTPPAPPLSVPPPAPDDGAGDEPNGVVPEAPPAPPPPPEAVGAIPVPAADVDEAVDEIPVLVDDGAVLVLEAMGCVRVVIVLPLIDNPTIVDVSNEGVVVVGVVVVDACCC